jgi:hypothetical protein
VNAVSSVPVYSPTSGKEAIDTLVLFIPLITAILTAITTFLTMLIKEKLFQRSRDKNNFIEQRLQNCYTVLLLKLQTSKDFKVGFLKNEINEIIVKNGYLLDLGLLNEYIDAYSLEMKALQYLELNKQHMSLIDDIKNKINALDKNDSAYKTTFESYTKEWKDCINQSQEVVDLYGKSEDNYINAVNSFRCNLETSYNELINQYYKYYNSDKKLHLKKP